MHAAVAAACRCICMLRQSLVGQCRFKFFSSRAPAELAVPVCHGCGGLHAVCRPARLHPDSSSSKRGFSFTGIYSLRRGDCGAAGCSGSDGGSNRWPAAADGAMEGYPSRANSLNAIKILVNPLNVIDPTCHRHKKNPFNAIQWHSRDWRKFQWHSGN